MNHVITKWRPFPGADRLPGIVMECTDPGNVRYALAWPWIGEDGMMYASDGRILIRLPMAGYEDLKCFKPGFGQPSDPRLKLKVVKQVDKTFAHGEGRILGLADLPIVSNPCSEPGPCPRTLNEVSGPADSYCDCDSCSGTFRIDEPVGGVPIGERDHRMALRYVYLLRYFGVHRVELPMHPETEPFRFEIGQVAGIVMPMTPPHRR